MSDRASLLRMLHELREGVLSDEDSAALVRLIDRDAEARRLYLEMTFLTASLGDALSESSQPVPATPARAASAGRANQRRIVPVALSLAAVLLFAAAVVAIYVFVSGDHRASGIDDRTSSTPIATLIESTGTLMVDDDLARPGAEYAAGAYSLDTGSAQFVLASRVTVKLRDHTRMLMHHPMRVTLVSGEAAFTCPTGAEGFTVRLPDGSSIVDLGTRFRVRAGDVALVEVLEGLVEYRGTDGRVTPIHGLHLAAVSRGRLVGISGASLKVNIDNAENPLDIRHSAGFETYLGPGERRVYASQIARDGVVGVSIVAPYFRSGNDKGYGVVTSLDESGDSRAGLNAVVNSGALINRDRRGPIEIEFDGLRPGRYAVRLYTHNVFDYEIRPVAGSWDISGAVTAENVPGTIGIDDPQAPSKVVSLADPDSIGHALFLFTVADDQSIARIVFTPDAFASNDQLWVNGFELHRLVDAAPAPIPADPERPRVHQPQPEGSETADR